MPCCYKAYREELQQIARPWISEISNKVRANPELASNYTLYLTDPFICLGDRYPHLSSELRRAQKLIDDSLLLEVREEHFRPIEYPPIPEWLIRMDDEAEVGDDREGVTAFWVEEVMVDNYYLFVRGEACFTERRFFTDAEEINPY